MVPQVTSIDHIYITVSDMARSQAFYTTVLGQVLGFSKTASHLSLIHI